MTVTFGSLFSGIGGIDLGFERAGMRCKWQVEIDPFCNQVLSKHWPKVKRYGDIKNVEPTLFKWTTVIAGGFPCQDISKANPAGQGINGERSGLWFDFLRVVRGVMPRWVMVENVPRLLTINAGRDFAEILRGLAEIGYDAEWGLLSAAAFGAPHERERLFIVAYPASQQGGTGLRRRREAEQRSEGRIFGNRRIRFDKRALEGVTGRWDLCPDCGGDWCEWHDRHREDCGCPDPWDGCDDPDTRWWGAEPAMGRMAYGIPGGVDRNSRLGNAVVPQVAEWIGRRIVEIESGKA